MEEQTRIALKRALLLQSDFLRECGKAHRSMFVDGDCQPLEELKALYGAEMVKVGLSLNQSRYRRVKRVKDKIGAYVQSGYAYFLTLTFTDEVLNRTSYDTRRQKVRRTLKKCCRAYVANIDFGDKAKNPQSNGREHYHALVYADDEKRLVSDLNRLWGSETPNNKETLRIGIYKLERVRYTPEDAERTSKYVAKLSNHAMKQDKNAKAPRLIYSRGNKCTLPPLWLFDEE